MSARAVMGVVLAHHLFDELRKLIGVDSQAIRQAQMRLSGHAAGQVDVEPFASAQ